MVAGERASRGSVAGPVEWPLDPCVTLFAEFPSPMTGPGPSDLTRLTRQLGLRVLKQAWQQITGQPLPKPVRNYVTRRHR